MKAYAIFDGGGVKGSALAGCLAAAQDEGIEFLGYGGTSAGSIVALLAAAGYSGRDLGELLVDLDLDAFLDDQGQALEALKAQQAEITRLWQSRGLWSKARALWKLRGMTLELWSTLGIYEGQGLKDFLMEKVKARVPALRGYHDITFAKLEEYGGLPLKIVASNVTTRRPAIFSRMHTRYGDSVIEAVRASSSFPFAFRPVERHGEHLVDGGLSSNLPSFLFAEEFRDARLPTFAFDLIAPARSRERSNDFPSFLGDMLATALEASDLLLRGVTEGVIHVPVHVPEGIDTMDFGISRRDRQALYNAGYEQAAKFLKAYPPLRIAKLAGNQLKRQLMARYGDPKLFAPVLAALARDIETFSRAKQIRANIMLPTGRQTRIVVYHYGMENDPDSDLELAEDAGCSGLAWLHRKPAVAEIDEMMENLEHWKVSPEDHAKMPAGRKSLLSVPIPSRAITGVEDADPLLSYRPIGTLTIDSVTALADTSWIEDGNLKPEIIQVLTGWAYVISRLLP